MGRLLQRTDIAIATGLALALVCGAASTARADACGTLDARGQCEGSQAVTWCDDSGGEPTLRTALCPGGEVCAEHDDFDGVLCLAIEETECYREGVPVERDICTTGNAVAFCSDGRVGVDPCGTDEVCRVEHDGNGDCIPAQAAVSADASTTDAGGSAPDVDAPAETDPGPGPDDIDPTGKHDEGSGPTPALTQGKPYTIPAGGGGCSSSPEGTPTSLAVCALMALLFLATRRRG